MQQVMQGYIATFNLISMRSTKKLLTVYSLLEECCFCWVKYATVATKAGRKLLLLVFDAGQLKIQKGIRNFRTEGTTATNLEVWFGKNVEAKVEFLVFVRT